MFEGDFGPVERSVRTAVAELAPEERDKAAAELAFAYARQIDAEVDLGKLGPLLLATLESLLMTPRARAAAVRGGVPDGGDKRSPLDELRERRARKSNPPDLDAATL